MNLRTKLVAGLAAVAISGALVHAAGFFPGFPVVGGPAYCVSTNQPGGPGTPTVCTNTAPAGPNATAGNELFLADTHLSQGQSPQSVLVPSALVGSINAKFNRLAGGDFNTNLWQRGTTPVSAASPSTTVIGADRWAVYSSGNAVTVTKQTGTADSIPTIGLYASMRVSRPSGTNNTAICVGQVLDKQAASALLGNNGVLSFYALAGAGLAAVDTSNKISVTIAYYTAADSATPLANTDTFMKGTITGYQAVTGGASNGTSATLAANVATVPITTTWARYSVWGLIPNVNTAGTAVTGAGVTFCYTPTTGTGGTTEWFELEGVQLQAMPSGVVDGLPNGVTTPTGFLRRTAAEEAVLQEYYTTSGGLGTELTGTFYQAGGCVATGNANFGINFNGPVRVAPTAATSTLTAGGYSIQTAAAVTAIGTITFATSTVSGVTLNSNAACTTTLPYQLKGTNTTGLILFVAEP